RTARARLARIGLELYAVRDAMRANPERTLADVKAMGYDDVELLWSFGNFGRTPAQVKATLAQVGLRAPSAHIAPEILLEHWEQRLDDARLIGHEYLIVPSLPAETDTSLDAWKRWADHFNVAGAAARKAGIWLAFHNEPGHQKPLDGQVPYDVFVARTDPALVRLQLDVGNMTMGGGDPMAYLTRHRDRYFSFHVKDIAADLTHDVELGHGIVNVRALLATIPDLAHKPVYVEQEGTEDAMGAARRDCAYLRALEF
ncbi:MAG TPA: sugar phosphate isomerase/epimerase, partial [Gemmatimonadaceae bacterium]|nr:sugar phosphate isomerase/epimerase [Gemmatimonadaceae bacterium]